MRIHYCKVMDRGVDMDNISNMFRQTHISDVGWRLQPPEQEYQ